MGGRQGLRNIPFKETITFSGKSDLLSKLLCLAQNFVLLCNVGCLLITSKLIAKQQ